MKNSYFTLVLSLFLIVSCNQKNEVKQVAQVGEIDSLSNQSGNVAETDAAEAWVRSIFKTESSDRYFPDFNVEEEYCSKRFYEFITDTVEIYGPSNITDEEYAAAERAYKLKWSKIYPIEEREMWLFGRGNGDIGELKDLKISKLKEGLYEVYIDYGGGSKTLNEITVITENGKYKIDYCKTQFLD